MRDGWFGGVEVEGFVEGEGGDVPGVVLEYGLDEGGVDGLVADGVGEDVYAVVDELAGVGEEVGDAPSGEGGGCEASAYPDPDRTLFERNPPLNFA